MTINNPDSSHTLLPIASRHVAVVGAGASGMVAARELLREGFKVTLFERQNQVGGTWVYNHRVEPDPLSLNPDRTIIHSSLYHSLRVNLPREVMGFRDYPFLIRRGAESGDHRRYPSHGEVLAYLKEFASEFGIEEMIKFETQVVSVRLADGAGDDNKWKVKTKKIDGGGGDCESEEEVFDAVVVCSGHNTEPCVADIPGISLWPGKQMHSHNYRVPEPFQDQIESAHEDGTVVFRNGRAVLADAILHCTGYKYYFPFLETNGVVTVDDNRVGPLYKHVFPPVLAPWLSFVGIPSKVIHFPMYELQSKWIAGVLSGRILLPSQEEMMEDVKAFYSELEASGIPKRYTHRMCERMIDYSNWLGAQYGCPGYEEWRKEMCYVHLKNKQTRPEAFRDVWENDDLVLQAHEDFAQYNSNKFTKR